MKKKIFISIGVIVLLGIAILVSQSIKGVSEVPVPIVETTAEPTPEPTIEPTIEPSIEPTEDPILYEIKPLIAEEEAPAEKEETSIVTPKEEATPEPTPAPAPSAEPKKEEAKPTQAPAQEAPQQTQPSGGITPEGQLFYF